MALDFQQVRQQVKALGEKAPLRQQRLQGLRELARQLLSNNAQDLERLRQKVQSVARSYDPTLRCALPVDEPLDSHFEQPALPAQTTILAADGSQIAPDRHAQVEYCLINVGAIQMRHGCAETPATTVHSQLYYDEQLYTPTGTITDARLALIRDLEERTLLARLAEQAPAPAITFTDGPMELWGSKDSESASDFQKSLDAYKEVLSHLCSLKVVTAGYVDKPAASPVVRLLEVASIHEQDLPEIKKMFPLRGVSDIDLYRGLLSPGERSAVFAIQSKSAEHYQGALGLHFFYLNVGRSGHPWISRVEIPAWVAEDAGMLDNLHAALVDQCRIMGNRPYPYLLHRAHEAAVVSLAEKEQVTQMIALELRRRGVILGEQSYKQSAKDLQGKTRYKA